MEASRSNRRLQGMGKAKSSSRVIGGSQRSLASSGHQQRRRYPTREVSKRDLNRLPSFRGNPVPPVPTTGRYPRLEEVGRLKSFRQQSLRKMTSIRNLETLRQGSFRQLDPAFFSEIANSSVSNSINFPEDLEKVPTPTPNMKRNSSFASSGYESMDSCHGPVHIIEFQTGQDATDMIEIELAPGVYKRLKGSEETQHAWDNDLCVEAMCFVCDCLLAVAPGCDAVICPVCRSISPVFKDDDCALSGESQDSCWLTLGDNDAVGLGIAIPEY